MAPITAGLWALPERLLPPAGLCPAPHISGDFAPCVGLFCFKCRGQPLRALLVLQCLSASPDPGSLCAAAALCLLTARPRGSCGQACQSLCQGGAEPAFPPQRPPSDPAAPLPSPRQPPHEALTGQTPPPPLPLRPPGFCPLLRLPPRVCFTFLPPFCPLAFMLFCLSWCAKGS